MIYLFFDIDGTLMVSGGAGRVAMTQVMTEQFGLSELHTIDVHGRTDKGIMRDLFTAHDIEMNEDNWMLFKNRYHELLPDCMNQEQGRLLPGVVELIEFLSDTPNVFLGILTGNSQSAATTKLKHYQLDHFFEFGGYGEHHCERNDVAREAWHACLARYPDQQASANQVWIVGDTPNDIRCARSIDANVVAVATGGSDLQILEQHQPDVLLADLTDKVSFLPAIQSAIQQTNR